MRRPAHSAIVAVGMMSLSAIATAEPKSEDMSVSVIKHGTGASSVGAEENFTGKVRVQGRFQRGAPARIGGATVTFEPGARTAWHTHPLGQTLIVTSGHGFVQEWGRPAQALESGDVAWIPPGVKHWHGAAPSAEMTHVALAESQDGKSVTWMEKVSDAQYRGGNADTAKP
ncbi:quercetin dioxygenase-like cupin family protein [Novosphingobium sp. PhB165]|uniref:(R)-mandelonitrile lyase n=1 Tax=Novosphingobium sp. PhB165 TaxID=2485105 RepID=UPI001045F5EB|nr:cupin domain-containing protein [Novosphingobium sp. PhB165]TCM15773.1 quercetin dioxygenase-like cupin family protein [Novosphingobium sp. PhB165]